MFSLLLSPFLPLLTKGIQKIGAPQQGISILSPYSEASQHPINYDKQNQASTAESCVPIGAEIQQSSTINHQSAINNQQPKTHNLQPTPSRIAQRPWAFFGFSYVFGGIIFLGLIIMGRYRIRRWRLDSRPCTSERILEIFRKARKSLGVERNILILESSEVPAPLSIGTLHPAIFIPQYLESQIDDEELKAIAFHETAHIKRHDPFIRRDSAILQRPEAEWREEYLYRQHWLVPSIQDKFWMEFRLFDIRTEVNSGIRRRAIRCKDKEK